MLTSSIGWVVPDSAIWDNLRASYAIIAGLLGGGLLIRMYGPNRFHFPSGRLIPWILIGYLILGMLDEAHEVGQPFNVVRLPGRIFLAVLIARWMLRNKQVYRSRSGDPTERESSG